MKKLTIIFLMIFITISFHACVRDDSHGGYKEPIEETEYKMLIKSLDKGFTVEEKDINDLEHHILAGKAKGLNINNDGHVYIYLYEDSEKMELDISNLSEDGFTYSNNKHGITIDWIYPPQYFKKGNMVVLYVGEDIEIINALEAILGSQLI